MEKGVQRKKNWRAWEKKNNEKMTEEKRKEEPIEKRRDYWRKMDNLESKRNTFRYGFLFFIILLITLFLVHPLLFWIFICWFWAWMIDDRVFIFVDFLGWSILLLSLIYLIPFLRVKSTVPCHKFCCTPFFFFF